MKYKVEFKLNKGSNSQTRNFLIEADNANELHEIVSNFYDAKGNKIKYVSYVFTTITTQFVDLDELMTN